MNQNRADHSKDYVESMRKLFFLEFMISIYAEEGS